MASSESRSVDPGFSGDEVTDVVDRVEAAIRDIVPEATRIFVEVGDEL